MPAKIAKISIFISVAAICAGIFLTILAAMFYGQCYKCGGHCSQVEADANNIAAAIADYFAIPIRTQIKPGDLDNSIAANPWTLVQCEDRFYIYVYDRGEKCPLDYQHNQPEWNFHIYTRIID